MKKSRLFLTLTLLLISGFILVACNNDSDSVGQGMTNEEDETNSEQNASAEQEDDVSSEQDPEVETEEGTEEREEEIEPEYYVEEETSSVIPIDDANENVVLLTFDDTPNQHAVEMAHTLKDLEVGAIFFVNGHFIDDEEGAEKLQEIHDMGFAIGNHTDSHPVIPDISEEEQTKEIVSLNDRIEEIIGERPKFFRAPHGMNSDHSNEVVKEEGMVNMNWTYGYDYFEPYTNAEDLTEAMVTGEGPKVDVDYSLLSPGANLLMHDRSWTNEALVDIVEGLQEQGYEMLDPNLIQTETEE